MHRIIFDNSNNDKRRENSDTNSIDSKKCSGILDDIPIWVTMLGNVHVLSAPRLFSPSLSVSPFGYLSIRIKMVVQASVVCWVNIGNVTSSMLCWAANGGYLTCFFFNVKMMIKQQNEFGFTKSSDKTIFMHVYTYIPMWIYMHAYLSLCTYIYIYIHIYIYGYIIARRDLTHPHKHSTQWRRPSKHSLHTLESLYNLCMLFTHLCAELQS